MLRLVLGVMGAVRVQALGRLYGIQSHDHCGVKDSVKRMMRVSIKYNHVDRVIIDRDRVSGVYTGTYR